MRSHLPAKLPAKSNLSFQKIFCYATIEIEFSITFYGNFTGKILDTILGAINIQEAKTFLIHNP
ncbi:MAG: hypothetical protein M3R14_05520 [Acidobacteriota bacterium]|nr:hypothetical protein [Acidobacteriota bacterium]